MIVLPTMHKRIRRSFLRLVLLFGALGVLMVTGITIAGRVPSELIRMNYDPIAYAQEMVRAMNGIRFPELYRDTDTLGWEKRGVLTAAVPLNSELTFYTRYGDYLGRISEYLMLLCVLYYIAYRAKKKNHLVK